MNIDINILRDNYSSKHRKYNHYCMTFLLLNKNGEDIIILNRYCTDKRDYLFLWLILRDDIKYSKLFRGLTEYNIVGSLSSDRSNEFKYSVIEVFKKIGIDIYNHNNLRGLDYYDNIKEIFFAVAEKLGYSKDDLIFTYTSS